MRHVDLQEVTRNPAYSAWASNAVVERGALIKLYKIAIATKTTHKFRASINKSAYKGSAAFLNAAFHRHCAYCESPVQPTQKYIDVEHHRPKLRIVDYCFDAPSVPRPYDSLLSTYIDASGKGHPGYFWLAYDIANLLPSCLACNRYEKKSNAIRLAIADFEAWGDAIRSGNSDLLNQKSQELDAYLEGRVPYSTAARTHIGILEKRFAEGLLLSDGMQYKEKRWGIWPERLVSTLP